MAFLTNFWRTVRILPRVTRERVRAWVLPCSHTDLIRRPAILAQARVWAHRQSDLFPSLSGINVTGRQAYTAGAR